MTQGCKNIQTGIERPRKRRAPYVCTGSTYVLSLLLFKTYAAICCILSLLLEREGGVLKQSGVAVVAVGRVCRGSCFFTSKTEVDTRDTI